MAFYENKFMMDAPFYQLHRWLNDSEATRIGAYTPQLRSPTIAYGATKSIWLQQKTKTNWANFLIGQNSDYISGSISASAWQADWVGYNNYSSQVALVNLNDADPGFDTIIGLVEFRTVAEICADKKYTVPFALVDFFQQKNLYAFGPNGTEHSSDLSRWWPAPLGAEAIINQFEQVKDYVVPRITWYHGLKGNRTEISDQQYTPYLILESQEYGDTYNETQLLDNPTYQFIRPPYLRKGEAFTNTTGQYGNYFSTHLSCTSWNVIAPTASSTEYIYNNSPWEYNGTTTQCYRKILINDTPASGLPSDWYNRYVVASNGTTYFRILKGSNPSEGNWGDFTQLVAYPSAQDCIDFFLNEWGITLVTENIDQADYGTPTDPGSGGGGGGGGGGGDDSQNFPPYYPPSYLDNVNYDITLDTPVPSAMNASNLYFMTPSQYQAALAFLNGNAFLNLVRTIFPDPRDVVLGIRIYPVRFNRSGQVDEVTFTPWGQDSGVACFKPNANFNYYIDGGSVSLESPQFSEAWQNYLRVKYQIYVPYVGVIDVPPEHIVGKTIRIKYFVNLVSGVATCYLISEQYAIDALYPTQNIFYITTCEIGEAVPYLQTDSANKVRNAMLGVGCAALAAASLGSATIPAASSLGAAQTAATAAGSGASTAAIGTAATVGTIAGEGSIAAKAAGLGSNLYEKAVAGTLGAGIDAGRAAAPFFAEVGANATQIVSNLNIRGSISGSTGSSPFVLKPYLVMTRYNVIHGKNSQWYRTMGCPTAKVAKVSDCLGGDGFCVMNSVQMNTSATEPERQEIIKYLNSGIRS